MGEIVYEAHVTIGKALNYYWKLQALESIQKSSSTTLPREELTKLIDTLIDNHEIKDILMKTSFPNVDYDYNSRESAPQIRNKHERKNKSSELIDKLAY